MRRIALVTGAGSGVGRATAVALAQAGFELVLSGRRQMGLEETAAMIGQAGEPLAVQVNVTDPASVDRLYGLVARERGRLDLLFNNAGIDVAHVPFEDLTFEQWASVVETNLTGQFLCAQGAFRLMKVQAPQGGRIINNGSVASQSPRPNTAPYAASKHGVAGLTKAIILDGRKYGICAGQIDIGNAAADPAAPRPPAMQADGERRPEPYMSYDSVAAAVVFMAGLPAEANVPFLTVMASAMPLVGRG